MTCCESTVHSAFLFPQARRMERGSPQGLPVHRTTADTALSQSRACCPARIRDALCSDRATTGAGRPAMRLGATELQMYLITTTVDRITTSITGVITVKLSRQIDHSVIPVLLDLELQTAAVVGTTGQTTLDSRWSDRHRRSLPHRGMAEETTEKMPSSATATKMQFCWLCGRKDQIRVIYVYLNNQFPVLILIIAIYCVFVCLCILNKFFT